MIDTYRYYTEEWYREDVAEKQRETRHTVLAGACFWVVAMAAMVWLFAGVWHVARANWGF